MNVAHTTLKPHNCGSVAVYRWAMATAVTNVARPAQGRHKGNWPGRRGEADIPFTCPMHRAEVAA